MSITIGCISDTHGRTPPAEDWTPMDIFIHAGDIGPDYNTNRKHNSDLQLDYFHTFCNWLKTVPAKEKIIIPGNHDGFFEDHPYYKLSTMAERYGATLLINSNYTSPNSGVRISGFSSTRKAPKYPYDWAYEASEDSLYNLYQDYTDPFCEILISHAPPFGYRDRGGRNNDPLGSQALTELIKNNHWPNLKYIICGHIHEAEGRETIPNLHIEVINCATRKDPVYISIDDFDI